MELTIKPVISCAGHDTLVAELEDRCLASISKEPAMWNHSKYRPPYPVCLQACFSRFTVNRQQIPVKILFTGRPIRPSGTLEPLVYLFIVANNVTSYNLNGGRDAIASWLGQLQSRNISEWLILVINADTQSGAPKIWQKSNVADKIKNDFKLAAHSHHFLQLPDSRSVDEKTFFDAWVSVMRSLRRMILEAYYIAIQDYNNHLSLLLEPRVRKDWDFMEFFDRKEDVAYLHTAVGAYEDALAEYDDLAAILRDFATLSANSALRDSWINAFMGTGNDVDKNLRRSLTSCPPIRCDCTSPQRKRVRDRTASLFDLSTYILARQYDLLSLMNRLDEFIPRAYDCISSTMQSARNFGACSQPLLLSCWTVLTALNSLELMQPPSSPPGSETSLPAVDDILLSVKCILATGFGCIRHPYDETFEALFPDDDLLAMGEKYRPTENILLDLEQPTNPLALPLANICHFLYSAMIATVVPLASRGGKDRVRKESPFTPGHIYKRRPHLTRNYLVQLWHLAFTHLTLLGQHGGQQPQLLVDIVTDMTPIADVGHMRGQWTAHIQQHLNLLLPISGAVYTDVFIAVAQIAISLFRLVDQATNAVTAATVLGGYLQSLRCTKFATYLYDSAFVIYQQENWPELTGFAHLRLASCLRSLLKTDEGNDRLAPELVLRYFYSCLALSSSSQSCFDLLRKHHALKQPAGSTTIPDKSSTSHLPLPYPTLPANCYSPDYWWLEVIALQESLPAEFVWEASWDLSSPFRIVEVRLEGADEAGFQLITLDIDVTSEASYFQVSLLMPCHPPTREDWQTLLCDDLRPNGTVAEHMAQPTEASSALLTVDLSSTRGKHHLLPKVAKAHRSAETPPTTPPPPVTATSTPRPTRTNAGEQGRAADQHVVGNPHGGRPHRTVNNLLDAAAAIATRAAWRSQDRLTEPKQSAANQRSSHIRSAVQNRTTLPALVSTAPQNYPRQFSASAVDSSRTGRNALGRRKQSVTELKIRYINIFEKAMIKKQQQHIRPGRAEKTEVSVLNSCYFLPCPSGSLTTSSHSVVLAPGLNTVQLMASQSGFYIPESIRLGVIRRAKNIQLASAPLRSPNPQPLFKLSYALQRGNFDLKTWANPSLLDSLLPSVTVVPAVGTPVPSEPATIHGLIGFRNPVEVELVLGKLAIDVSANLSIGLYRCFPSTVDAATKAPTSSTSNSVKAPNEYSVEILSVESDRPKRMVAGCLVEPMSSSNFKVIQTRDTLLSPFSRLRLTSPLWLTAFNDEDKFMAFMPFGNFKRLPVETVRPFVFTLKLYAFQDTDILFFINIACMDMLDTFAAVTSSSTTFTELQPPSTYRLAKFELKVVSATDSLVRDTSTSDSNYRRSEAGTGYEQQSGDTEQGSADGRQVVRLEGGYESKAGEAAQLLGAPIDPEMMEVSVNRLRPASLLWRFKLVEFRHFVYDVLETSKQLPLVRFTCSISRWEDPKFESQLIFQRFISPGRSDVSASRQSVANPLSRREGVLA